MELRLTQNKLDVILVCGVSAWLLLHVYVLVYVLDFVIVLFQSGVFEYISYIL